RARRIEGERRLPAEPAAETAGGSAERDTAVDRAAQRAELRLGVDDRGAAGVDVDLEAVASGHVGPVTEPAGQGAADAVVLHAAVDLEWLLGMRLDGIELRDREILEVGPGRAAVGRAVGAAVVALEDDR